MEMARKLFIVLTIVLCASVALGQDSRGGRRRNRGGDRASAGGSAASRPIRRRRRFCGESTPTATE